MWTKLSLSLIALLSAFALGASAVTALGATDDKQGKSRELPGRAKKDKQEDKKNGQADERGSQGNRKIAKKSHVVVIDRDGHLRVVREFYAGRALPPGLAKRESLPPGLSKQLRERGRLPPGLQKRLRPVPPELVSRLPSVPPYYRRYFADRDLVIVDSRTDRIVAVIRAIVP
jgi:hypothetical protein